MTPSPSRRLAITRDISSGIENCELTHLERTTIDLARARAQHEHYEATLRDLGCEIQRLSATDQMPDSVFIEDTALVLDELAVITRPGAESRRVETPAVADALRVHRPIAAILAPGTLDGGDIVRLGRRILVGVGYRSNDAGVKQMRAIVGSQDYTVDGVPFTGCLHLKSAASIVADDLVLVNPEWVDVRYVAPYRTIDIDPSEPFAANALLVGDAIIHSAEFPKTRKRLEAEGLKVYPVPNSELAKAEGGVTCCSLILSASR